MAEENLKKKPKLILKKTDTSRLKRNRKEEEETQLVTPDLPPEDTSAEIPDIVDPMTVRNTDTSRLKKLTKQQLKRTSLDDEIEEDEGVSRETVHLKIIKEKKKQLAGILTASQTIRLRPSANKKAPSISDEGSSGDTLKVKDAPRRQQAGSTVKLTPKIDPQATTKAAAPPSKPSLKLKAKTRAPGKGDAGKTVDLGAPVPEGEDTKTQKLKLTPKPTTKDAAQTLAPSPITSDKTLKLKPKGDAKQTVAVSPGSDASQTAELAPNPAETSYEAPVKKTLKLKSKKSKELPKTFQKPQGAPSPTSKAATREDIEDLSGAEPGIFLTVTATAAMVLLGVTMYFILSNYLNLMQV
ncbi:MAG: hypothetical protein U9O87_09165 [Verrucomicrobiota bacterium]|nr:hypothetical protein [Verrucomicrobiota bacterium]